MKNVVLSIFLVLIFAAACTNKSDSTQKLQDEVIAIHDEVMPMMGTFAHNSIAIDSILNNFEQIKADQPDIDTVQQREALVSLKSSIDQASEAMNDWMHQLELDFEGKSNEEIESYLQKEKTKIEEINVQFKEVEKRSDEILQPYRNTNVQ